MAAPANLTVEHKNSSRVGLVSSFGSQRSYGTVKVASPSLNPRTRHSSILEHKVQESDTFQGLALKYSVTVRLKIGSRKYEWRHSALCWRCFRVLSLVNFRILVNHLVQQGARVTVTLYSHESPACKAQTNKILLSISCLRDLGTQYPSPTTFKAIPTYGCLIIHPLFVRYSVFKEFISCEVSMFKFPHKATVERCPQTDWPHAWTTTNEKLVWAGNEVYCPLLWILYHSLIPRPLRFRSLVCAQYDLYTKSERAVEDLKNTYHMNDVRWTWSERKWWGCLREGMGKRLPLLHI